MKLKRLEMKAFGPFTDRILEFDSQGSGLHIIYGQNEAGKSSSLRALKALLYGFPMQTPDNFIHSYDQLLVGGCIENESGKEFYFQRRKKKQGDILDAAGNPVRPEELAPFLRSVEPEIFESLYGIDHAGLVKGGEDILASKGEVGQALFAAASGVSSLGEVAEKLEQEAADLFKSAGQLPEINKAIKRYKELQSSVKEISLSTKEWKDHRKALESELAARGKLEQKRNHKNLEWHRLERLRQAVPELASLALLQEQLRITGEIVHLPSDFAERFHLVSQGIREAGQNLQRENERLVQLVGQRQNISLNQELLSQAEVVDDFHQRLGEYRKGQKDRPVREGMRISLRQEAGALLEQVRPDVALKDVESLRPVLAKKRTVQALSPQYAAIREQLVTAEKRIKTGRQEQVEIEGKLAVLPELKDHKRLQQVIKLAQKAGDIDTLLAKGSADVDLGKRVCLTDLNQIGLWLGDLSALMELALPLSVTLDQFEKDYSLIADKKREILQDRDKNVKDLKYALAEAKKMEYAYEVPTEQELAKSRDKRQEGWKIVRQQWLDKIEPTDEARKYHPDLPLADAYEYHVEQADSIADRLRREADRVAKTAALRVQIEELHEALAESDRKLAELEQQGQGLDERWKLVWEHLGIHPRTPKEMIAWLAKMEKLRFQVAEIRKKEQELEPSVSM